MLHDVAVKILYDTCAVWWTTHSLCSAKICESLAQFYINNKYLQFARPWRHPVPLEPPWQLWSNMLFVICVVFHRTSFMSLKHCSFNDFWHIISTKKKNSIKSRKSQGQNTGLRFTTWHLKPPFTPTTPLHSHMVDVWWHLVSKW